MVKKREIKPGPIIPEHGHIEAFAIIVDLNQFTAMVSIAEKNGDLIAQFIRDALSGAIDEIEAEGGEVVAFIGDAVLGIIPDGNSAVRACFGIAKDIDGQCEYISPQQRVPADPQRLDIADIHNQPDYLSARRAIYAAGFGLRRRMNMGSKGR